MFSTNNEDNPKYYEDISAICQKLKRHLSAASEIKSLSQVFGALNSNLSRVDFALNLLEKFNISAEFVKDQKSDEDADKLREEGNAHYKARRFKEAREFYTRSIQCAETAGSKLAMAYANRSAVFYELKLYHECLERLSRVQCDQRKIYQLNWEDIDRAQNSDYPETLRQKLLLRQENSRRLLNTQAKTLSHELVPEIVDKNSLIQNASSAIKVAFADNLGRHIVATREIEAGEVLAVEKPFASILVDQKLSHCHHCLNVCYNLVPCENCTVALYCSAQCRNMAYGAYHEHECPVMRTALALNLDKLKLLPLRIALVVSFDGFPEKISSDDKTEEPQVYRSDRYKEIHNLITNTSRRSVSDLFDRATIAAVIFKLIKSHSTFFGNAHEKTFKEVLLLHMQTGPSNFHEISELARNEDGIFVPTEIGAGAFSFLSLLNHSCCPNVIRSSYCNTVVLRSLRKLDKGEQCLDNYGYDHAVTPKLERQQQLQSQYYFDCQCEACQKNWAMYDDLPVINEVGETDESIMLQLSAADLDTAKTVLKDSLAKLPDLEKYRPCKNYCQVQEIVKQCFAIFGNKRYLF